MKISESENPSQEESKYISKTVNDKDDQLFSFAHDLTNDELLALKTFEKRIILQDSRYHVPALIKTNFIPMQNNYKMCLNRY